MSSPASIGKHPIHPMLIAFPVGLWVFSLVCDIIYFASSGADVWKVVALYTLGGGIIGALLAAVPGLIDLLSIHEQSMKKTAITHMIVNLIAVVIFVVDFWLRLGSAPDTYLPFILSIIGVLFIGVGGWLGGEMVYVKGMAVEAAENPPARQTGTSGTGRRAA